MWVSGPEKRPPVPACALIYTVGVRKFDGRSGN
jgi:hypothetical protein